MCIPIAAAAAVVAAAERPLGRSAERGRSPVGKVHRQPGACVSSSRSCYLPSLLALRRARERALGAIVFSCFSSTYFDRVGATIIQTNRRSHQPTCPSALLSNGFEKHDGNRGCEIEAASAVHGNGQEVIAICLQQTFRQAFRFAPEDKKIAGLEARPVVGPIAFCREIETASPRPLCGLELA